MSFIDFIKGLFNNGKKNCRLIVQKDLTKIKGENTPLEVGLYENKTPLVDKEVNIKINGVNYKRKTDDDGIAKLNINLNVGVYENTLISFEDNEYNYTSAYCTVIVNPKLTVQDLVMTEKDGGKFTAGLKDAYDNPIVGAKVKFNINGVDYERESNGNGISSLNINLNEGVYEVTTSIAGLIKSNHVTVKAQPPKDTRMEGVDVNKVYGESGGYQCAVYSDEGRIAVPVDITINGVTYNKTPDIEGLCKLNINLNPGTYTIKAEFKGNPKYNGSSVTNKVVINEPPKPPEKSYSQQILEYFESQFGGVDCFDDALEKIEDRGYAYYYNSQFSNRETINRIARGNGANCTDSCQVFWHIAKALGYEVQLLHIGCLGGDGHVRLRLRKNGNDWFYRDPACVLEDNGRGITANWCMNGNLWAINPSWFFEDLEW